MLPSLAHLRRTRATYASHLANHVWPLVGDRRMGWFTRSA